MAHGLKLHLNTVDLHIKGKCERFKTTVITHNSCQNPQSPLTDNQQPEPGTIARNQENIGYQRPHKMDLDPQKIKKKKTEFVRL